MDATTKTHRTIRVVRVGYTGRVVKVIRDGFATVDEAEQFVDSFGRGTGCTMQPWGEPRTRNVVEVKA